MKSKLTVILFFSITLFGCHEYEVEVSSLTYDKEDFLLSDGLIEDWGGHSGDHYNSDVYLIGEKTQFISQTNAEGQTSYKLDGGYEWVLFVELFSPGQEVFQTGNFQALGNRDLDDVHGEFVFRTFMMEIAGIERVFSREGMIHVRKAKDGIYRLKFDLKTVDGETFVGQFIGSLNYLDKR